MKLGQFVLYMLLTFSVKAQYNLPINYGINAGLPSSEVYHMLQTADGHMWFATDRGICRFNGYNFQTYSVKDGLPDNTVFHFYSWKNRTWATTLSGALFSFSSKLDFKPYPFNAEIQSEISNATLSNIFEHQGALYLNFNNLNGYVKVCKDGSVENNTIGYSDHKLLLYERVGEQGFAYTAGVGDTVVPLFKNSEIFMYETEHGNAFSVLDMGSFIVFSDFNDVYLNESGKIRVIAKDKYPIAIGQFSNDSFWVGYRFGGYVVYNNKGEVVFEGLKSESVTSLVIDHEQGVWASTLNSGVFYSKHSVVHQLETDSLMSSTVTSITANDQDEIFVGYNDGNIMQWKNGRYSLFYQAQKKVKGRVQYYRSIGKTVINADFHQFFSSNPDSTFYEKRVVRSYDDNPDHLPALGAHSSYCIGLSQKKEKHVNFRINDLTTFKGGYCFASNDGLYYVKAGQETVNKLIPNCTYRFEEIDAYNTTYYAGSLGYGLFVYSEDSLYVLNKSKGLYSDMVSAVTIENDSVFWVCTNRGLNHVEIGNDGVAINGLSHAEGLPSNEVICVEIKNDTAWVGTKSGACYFPKNALEIGQNKTKNYYLSLQKVKLNGAESEVGRFADLEHFENNLEFFFQGISYAQNERLVYAYRLKGLDKFWHETKAQSVRYPAIPPGEYTFQLKIHSSSFPGAINTLEIPVVIAAPYYQTWWFILLVLAGVVGVIYLFFKLYILTYNRDVVRELLRHLLKRIKRKDTYVVFRVDGKDVRVDSKEIIYVKAAGNYLDVFTQGKKYTVRCKISDFLALVPDSIEFVRVHRSYIVRIDHIKKKDKKTIYLDEVEIPITKAYKEAILHIQF